MENVSIIQTMSVVTPVISLFVSILIIGIKSDMGDIKNDIRELRNNVIKHVTDRESHCKRDNQIKN